MKSGEERSQGKGRYLFRKHFTVEEANALIPFLRQRFAQIHALVGPFLQEWERLQHIFRVARDNGGGKEASDYIIFTSLIQRFIMEIFEQGVLIRDLKRGLVDFPHLREGREVFLCWELKDPDEVVFWHDLDAGYAGRRPLEDIHDDG
jgi:hypothetical protein